MTTQLHTSLEILLELDESDRTPDINIIIASIATTLGLFSQADHALKSVESARPLHNEWGVERGRWLLEVADYDSAITHCNAQLADSPQNTPLKTIILDALFRSGRYAEAVARFNDFGAPTSLELVVIAARCAMRLGNPTLAKQWLDAHLTQPSKHADAYFLRSQLAFLDMDTRLAVGHLETACRLAPDLIEAVNQLIHSYIELNEWNNALVWIKRCIDRNPNDPEQQLRLAIVHDGLGDHDAAIQSINRAIELDPKSVELRCARVSVYVNAGQLKPAMADLKELVDTHPKNSTVYGAFGVALQAQNRWEDAMKAFQKSIDLGANDPSIFASLGTTYLALGQRDAAKQAFSRAHAVGGGTDFEIITNAIG